MRGKGLMLFGRNHEMDMRRAHRVSTQGFQHDTHGTISWYWIGRWLLGTKPKLTLAIRVKNSPKIHIWKPFSFLNIVKPLGRGLPNIQFRVGDRSAIDTQYPPRHQGRFTGPALGNISAKLQFGCAGHMKWTQYSALSCAVWFPMR